MSVDDVCSFIESLELGDHKDAFREGSVDGTFLMQLTSEVIRLPSVSVIR